MRWLLFKKTLIKRGTDSGNGFLQTAQDGLWRFQISSQLKMVGAGAVYRGQG